MVWSFWDGVELKALCAAKMNIENKTSLENGPPELLGTNEAN